MQAENKNMFMNIPPPLVQFKIVAAFRGMHVSPAKNSFRKCDVTDGQTDGRQTKWSLCVPMLCRRHKKSQCTNFLNHPILLPAARDINQNNPRWTYNHCKFGYCPIGVSQYFEIHKEVLLHRIFFFFIQFLSCCNCKCRMCIPVTLIPILNTSCSHVCMYIK